MRNVPYPSPSEILREEFLNPLSISPQRLAQDIGISQQCVDDIIAGNRDVNADTGLRLSRYFGLSEGFWTGLQDDYNRAVTKDKLHDVLLQITPLDCSRELNKSA
jgi:addiction module HigA family antidote